MTNSTDTTASAQAPQSRFSLGSGWGNIFGRFLALIAVFVFFAILVEGGKFYTLRNLENLLRQSAVYATAGLGMTMVIIAAGGDLSPGPLFPLPRVAPP